LLKEENEALLEQARREFQAATAERIMLFGKPGDTPVAETRTHLKIASAGLLADGAVAAYQLGLRRAGQKAWNAYVVLLATNETDYAQSIGLGAIEEDLAGTRKIALGSLQQKQRGWRGLSRRRPQV
jgi:hypothetical protein